MSCILYPPQPNQQDLITGFAQETGITNLIINCSGYQKDGDNYTPITDVEFLAVWGSNTQCPAAFSQSFFNNQGQFNTASFQTAQLRMQNAIFRYFSANPFNPSPYTSSVVEDNILNTCYNIPGLCANSQTKMCKGCTDSQVSTSLNLINFCGCYVDESQQLGLTPECGYTCTLDNASKLRNVINGNVLECNQTVCVINDITINATNTSLQNINFNQVCNQCTSGQCSCFIDVSIPEIINRLGISGPSFTQKCPKSECYTVNNQTGNVVKEDCANYTSLKYQTPVGKSIWWILSILLILFLFVLFSFWFWGDEWKQVAYTLYTPPLNPKVVGLTSKDF